MAQSAPCSAVCRPAQALSACLNRSWLEASPKPLPPPSRSSSSTLSFSIDTIKPALRRVLSHLVEMDVGCRQISDLGSPVMRPAPLLPSPFARHLRARASARDSYSLRDFDSFQPSSKMKQPALFRRTVSFLVEMARVELASESNSTGLSPSAADVLNFAPLIARQQAAKGAISLFPYDTENSRKVFLYSRCQISGLQVNQS